MRTAAGIVEDGEAREVNVAAADEIDVRTRRRTRDGFAFDVVADRAEDFTQRGFLAWPHGGEHRQGIWHAARCFTWSHKPMR
jgi:hypothetical protein